jgi:predicted nuclease of predicted toxin-antitoxin system
VKFLLDESVDVRLRRYLTTSGHDATAVGTDYIAGMTDRDVLSTAHSENRILITNDSDFGALVVAEGRKHSGVILMRLGPTVDLQAKIDRLNAVLQRDEQELHRFVVVTNHRIRIR